MTEAIAKLLRAAIGMDSASIGMASIERAVQRRIHATKTRNVETYHELVRGRLSELTALIEAVVVPETWFFRDPGAFTAVVRAALRHPVGRSFRVLCLPCSTGEEPYSMAMAMLDAGIPPERIHIDAFDVSHDAVAAAQRGFYSNNSFRSPDLTFRDRHFKPAGKSHELSPEVRKLVTFRQANLLDEKGLPGAEVYRAIFCRNLLIYFDGETQRRAIRTLGRLLDPEGMLCVAPAETGLLLRHDFTPARLPLAFAFRKGPAKAESKPAAKAPPAPLPRVPLPAPPKPRRAAAPVAPAPVSKAPTPRSLADAARLADEGRFADVADICRAVIEKAGPSAEAFYLMGLVSDATGRAAEAAALYRKALYLDPRHRETLVHFSLLSEKQGDKAAARTLRERALRLEPEAAK
jgi:chemotaxis protein methyltransferase WspC